VLRAWLVVGWRRGRGADAPDGRKAVSNSPRWTLALPAVDRLSKHAATIASDPAPKSTSAVPKRRGCADRSHAATMATGRLIRAWADECICARWEPHLTGTSDQRRSPRAAERP
jgi:hypothetical protein